MNEQKITRSRAENETSMQLLGANTDGAQISDGPIENFKEGWALPVFSHGKAHYFKLKPFTSGINPRTSHHRAVSNCGLALDADCLLGPGNFEKCQKCMKSIKTLKG